MSTDPKDSATVLVQVITRIPRDLRDDLQRIAAREDRSVAAEVRRLIRARVDEDAQQEAA